MLIIMEENKMEKIKNQNMEQCAYCENQFPIDDLVFNNDMDNFIVKNVMMKILCHVKFAGILYIMKVTMILMAQFYAVLAMM